MQYFQYLELLTQIDMPRLGGGGGRAVNERAVLGETTVFIIKRGSSSTMTNRI